MPLVPFPDRDKMFMLVNPEHITSLTPAISRGPAPVSLSVRVKILGLGEMNLPLGSFESQDAAEVRWSALLSHLGNVVLD